jgi:hypothetical protein
MTHQEAKQVLILYRPGAGGADDPELKTALARLKEDPELAHWFEGQQAFHSNVRARLQEIPVPEGLKEQIVSERRVRLNPGFRKKTVVAALALALVCLVAVLAVLHYASGTPNSFDKFQKRMARIVLREYPRMDKETSNLEEIRQYLVSRQAHGDYHLPSALEQTASTGCAVLSWHGQRVSMVCFNSNNFRTPGAPSDLFLFIIDRAAISSAPAQGPPQLAQVNRLTTASWSEKDKTYILGTLGGEDVLRKFL